MSIYDFYGAEIGIHLSKVFDLSYIFCGLVFGLLNYLFVKGSEFRYIFVSFIVI